MASRLRRIALLRESRYVWERRAPLLPSHVATLRRRHPQLEIAVQPCTRRIAADSDYVDAGAVLSERVDDADLLIGIKEVAVAHLLPGCRYIFFSHTHKAQSHNMPMLSDIINKKITLLDHELLRDPNDMSVRLLKFGRHAGIAGLVDGLHSLGRRLLGLGYSTPFLNIAMSHSYPTVAHAENSLRDAGAAIAERGLPRELCPFNVILTGSGSVSKGAQEMLRLLPFEKIPVNRLRRPDAIVSTKKINLAVVSPADYCYLKNTNNHKFDRADFGRNPQNYSSNFIEKIAPYASMLVTGHYWDPNAPRLISNAQLRANYESWRRNLRMLTVADISCDIKGSIEFTTHATPVDDPYYIYDPVSGNTHKNLSGQGVQVMAVDILPTEFPLESSTAFGDALLPIIEKALKSGLNTAVLRNATIVEQGKLMPEHEWLSSHLKEKSLPFSIVILGSGYVSGPVIQYLTRFPDTRITLVTQSSEEAERLLENALGDSNAVSDGRIAIKVVSDAVAEIDALLKGANVAISLLPAALHVQVARACLRAKAHLVTASYVSPDMEKLDGDARRENLVFVNEMGLDPGIDHMTATQLLDSIRIDNILGADAEITGFRSFCGGLPAPEDAGDNPMCYKFSWSPRGALLAALQSARYIENGKEVNIHGDELMRCSEKVNFLPSLNLRQVPNRDSTRYIEKYGLNRNLIQDMKRCTLRFPGYAEYVDAFRILGLLNDNHTDSQKLYKSLTSALNDFLGNSEDAEVSLHEKIIERLVNDGHRSPEIALQGMGELGIFNARCDREVTPITLLAQHLASQLSYRHGERDMVVMRHEIDIKTQKTKQCKITGTLVVYGQKMPKGPSAMALTVGLPAAAAARLILENKINSRGIVTPTSKELYEPVLKLLKEEGIEMKINVTKL